MARWRLYISAGLVLGMAALALVLMGQLGDASHGPGSSGHQGSADDSTPAHSRAHRPSAPAWMHPPPSRPASDPRDTVPAGDHDQDTGTGHATVNAAEVEAALARFNEVSAQITQEQLDAEQARMRRAREEFSATDAPEPTARPIVDSRGFRWIELTYPSGEVRYELPP